jgi:hypothetical protein
VSRKEVLGPAHPHSWHWKQLVEVDGDKGTRNLSIFAILQVLSFKMAEIVQHIFQETEETTKYVYIKSTTAYVPSSEIGLSQPLSNQRLCPSPQNRGEGHTIAVEGLGKSQFQRLEEKLSTPALLLRTVSKFSGQCSKYSATVEKKFGP